MSERALHTFRRAGLLALAILTGIGAWAVAGQDSAPPGFDHALHAPLFPGGCLTCHAGVSQAGAALWPAIESCANCHDGEVEARVEWQPPTRPPASNLRFAHDRHATATRDSVSCGECHAP
ncbi:MAG: cytochrome c family protein, partial [Gemmatimonadales bacterium]|nr:cytochrome c family protein [Gemmatimonadales bacterium]